MLFVALAVLLAVVLVAWWLIRSARDVDAELERFAAARSTTNRWAQDPSSAPRPVLDIAERGGAPVPEQQAGDSLDATG